MSKYLTVDEIADMLRVKRQTIYVWITKRQIPSISLGGRTLFDEAEISRWISAKNRKPINNNTL